MTMPDHPSEKSRWHERRAREQAPLRKRQRQEAAFRLATLGSVLVAAAFLAIVLCDLIRRGYPALRQAEILVNVRFQPDVLSDVDLAFDPQVRDLVSRAAHREVAREAQRAEIRLAVTYLEEVRADPRAAIGDVTITKDDMPPWKRNFEDVTIPRQHLLRMVSEEGLSAIRAALQADPSLAGSTQDEWLRGSDALQQFLADSTGFDKELTASAEVLDEADMLQRGFNAIKFGEQGRIVEQWVLADADVDQYLKGYRYMQPGSYRDRNAAPISEEKAARIQRLYDEGRIRLSFNWRFFLSGDSKLPEAAGIYAAVMGSVFVLTLVLVFCLPVGVLTSIYLEEFAPDNVITQIIEVNINNLAAIPSILFGVFGLAAFINFFNMPRSSVLVGAATLALMTLPVIIISSRAALRAVPESIRRAGLAMGATRSQVVLHHVLPASLSGILTGSIIGLAQAMGETAPLIVIGLVAFVPEAPLTPTDPTTVMPAQIFSWWSMPQRAFQERAALAIVVLLVVLFFLNGLAVLLRARSERTW